MVNFKHILALVVVLAGASSCAAPTGPTCSSDEDCGSEARCLSSGGLFYGDSYCVPITADGGSFTLNNGTDMGMSNNVGCETVVEAACDGVDDNGNDVIDEGCACSFAGSTDGVCGEARIDCNGSCQEPIGYEFDEQLCDGLDNDCDGAVDEGTPFQGTVVATGGSHTCALDLEGRPYCWGRNNHGQLGDGTTDDTATPTRVLIEVPLSDIVAGANHTCGIGAQSGAIYCWGLNDFSQVIPDGGGPTDDILAPYRIDPLAMNTPWTNVTAGTDFTCAISSGNIYCWGNNNLGQTGNMPSQEPVTTPTPIDLDPTVLFADVGAGDAHACGQSTSGTGYCWGLSTNNRLSRMTTGDYGEPAQIQYNDNLGEIEILHFDTGFDHTCATAKIGVEPLDITGVICNGANNFGQLGGTPEPEYVDSNDVGPVKSGNYFACVYESPQGVTCWGANDFGQAGRDPVATVGPGRVNNLPVSGDNRVTDLDAGGQHACAALEGGIYCWGDNEFGQLGTTIAQPGTTPVACVP